MTQIQLVIAKPDGGSETFDITLDDWSLRINDLGGLRFEDSRGACFGFPSVKWLSCTIMNQGEE